MNEVIRKGKGSRVNPEQRIFCLRGWMIGYDIKQNQKSKITEAKPV